MKIDKNNEKHIIAEEGKTFRRKADGKVYGSEIYLGYTYEIGGVLLPEKKLEIYSDFDEIEFTDEDNRNSDL